MLSRVSWEVRNRAGANYSYPERPAGSAGGGGLFFTRRWAESGLRGVFKYLGVCLLGGVILGGAAFLPEWVARAWVLVVGLAGEYAGCIALYERTLVAWSCDAVVWLQAQGSWGGAEWARRHLGVGWWEGWAAYLTYLRFLVWVPVRLSVWFLGAAAGIRDESLWWVLGGTLRRGGYWAEVGYASMPYLGLTLVSLLPVSWLMQAALSLIDWGLWLWSWIFWFYIELGDEPKAVLKRRHAGPWQDAWRKEA